jgi:amino acid adenylation domain-containing protein
MISSLIKKAVDAGVFLFVEDQQLKFKLSVDEFPQNLKTEILSRKQEIIEFLSQQSQAVKKKSFPKIEKRKCNNLPLALSFSQQRMWFIDELQEGDSSNYNMSMALDVQGAFELDIAERALKEIINRHEILRTNYQTSENGPVQIIKEDHRFLLTKIDLVGLPDEEQESEIKRHIEEDTTLAFDLRNDLMLRVSWLQLQSQRGILMFNIHHIASDGWSEGVIFGEFTQLYHAWSNNKANNLEPLTIQYADYALWQQEHLQREALAEQLNYWSEQLENAPTVHSLPLDFERPLQAQYIGASVVSELPSDVAKKVEQLALNYAVTPFMVFHAVFSLVLSRHSNTNNIVIGTTVANRQQKELENLVGFFVNTLALHSETDSCSTFVEYLKKIKKINLDAQEHQDLPFEQLVEHLRIPRSMQHSPLVQIMFSMDTNEIQTLEVEEVKFTPIESDNVNAITDINFIVEMNDQGISLYWSYDRSLFKVETIERLNQHFTNLLDSVIAEPESKLTDLSMLSVEETGYLLNTLNSQNSQNKPLSPQFFIHNLFERMVDEQPESIAISFENQTGETRQLTYSELNRQANKLAHYLREQGVVAETLVGISVERSIDMVIGLLAIVKAGGAYVPLDPHYPLARLQHIVEMTEIKQLLTEVQIKDRLELDDGGQITLLDSPQLKEVLKAYPETNLVKLEGYTENSLAYVLFTSGSTGKPKGVMVEQRALVNFILAMNEQLSSPFTASTKLLAITTIAFDIAGLELFCPLAHGGQIVLASKEDSLDPTRLSSLLTQHNIKCMQATPATWDMLVNSGWSGKKDLLALSGGEALPVELAKQVLPLCDQLWNCYGPTEATIWSLVKQIKEADLISDSIHIGSGLKNYSHYILSNNKQLLPLGSVGELYIGGSSLARGYFSQPELTTNQFIASPFKQQKNELLYKTGDLVRYLPNGDIEYIGRIDEQVKIRGFRIELGEIEHQLLQSQYVSSCLVIAREDEPGKKRLVAYVTVTKDNDLDDKTLISSFREHLKKMLPEYMLPAVFMVLAQFPLTPNGKIDKKGLPAPDASLMLEVYLAPQTTTEVCLCEIWQDVLAIEQVGIEDNFFTIGGDSIRALSVIAKGRKLGLDFSVKDLFINPTIHGLACAIKAEKTSSVTLEVIEPFSLLTSEEEDLFSSDGIEDAYPLTELQQGMVFHNLKDESEGTYHDLFGFKVTRPWQESFFKEALQSLVNRHASFRTVFFMDQPRPLQVTYKASELFIEVFDLKMKSVKEQNEEIINWSKFEKNQNFDLSKPLWKIVVHVLGNDEFYYSLSCHHALWDGWSIANLNAELFNRYQSMLTGVNFEEPVLPLPYVHFVAQELKALSSEEASHFWQEKLDQGNLPWWTSMTRGHIDNLEFQLSQKQSELLTSLAKTSGVQEKTVLLTIHMLLMRLLGGEEDVVSSVVVHGRPEAENSDKTLGLFLNSLPLRLKSFDCSWKYLINNVERELLDILEHQNYPLSEIQRQSQLDFSASLFNYIDFHVLEDIATELDVTEGSGFDQTNYLFDGDYAKDLNSGLFTISIKVDTLAFSQSLRAKITGYLDNIINTLLHAPREKINIQALLGEKEIARLLSDFNSPQIDYLGEAYIHQRFETQVEQNPEGISVVHNGRSYTYNELNCQANRLAHHLKDIGITRNTLVGIFAQRSPEFLVAMLAIMKAGGAYVPLDPMNPKKRINYMMADAQLCCLLTESQLLNQLSEDNKLPEDMTVICLDSLATNIDQTRVTNPTVVNEIDDLAYMIYTSGSTGQPKGALIHHGGALNHIDAEFDVLGFMNTDKTLEAANFLQSAASSSDVSVWQFLAPVVSGGCTVILDEMTDMPTLIELIQCYDVHLIETAPVVLQLLVDHVLTLDEVARQLPSLRWLMTIAEATPVGLVNNWFSLYPNIPIMNGFGPSEASDDITYHIIREPLAHNITSVPIGKPLANLTMYVLSENSQLQAIGVPGEICVSGIGVGLGYWNNPEKTNEAFIENPFAGQFNIHGNRLYRTGDLGRWLPEGELEFMGRIDNQVKIRGFRVELGEVEAELARIEGIGDVAVLVHKSANGENSLSAYIVQKASDNMFDAGSLRIRLSESLPDHMLPSTFTFLEEMPLNAADKIDRLALPTPDSSANLVEYIAPQTLYEEVLAQAWQELLSIERVGTQDNFFLLGGHSLLAMQLTSRLRQRLDIELSLNSLFTYPRLADLAIQLENITTSSATEILVVDRSKPLALSYGQQRLWFIDQMDKQGSAAYNMSGCMKLTGKLDQSALHKALERIVERHEALRTRFVVIDGEAKQVIDDSFDFSMEISYLNGAETEEYMQICELEVTKPFDLATGSLLRCKLLVLEDEQHILLITMHHIISDGWSMGIFSQELSVLYSAFRQGKPDVLAKLAIQYVDFSQWQRQQSLQNQQEYWLEQLNGAPELLSLPTDRVRPEIQDYTGATIDVTLDKELTSKLTAFSRTHGTTLYMTLLAAWAALNSRLSSQNTVVIGSPNANRNRVELESMIGFFVNTQAMRIDFEHQPNVSELLHQVKEVALAAQDHQDIPFEQVVEAINPVRSISHNPIFQIMFTWQNTPEDTLDFSGLHIEQLETDEQVAQFDLSLDLIEDDGHISGSLNYATALFDKATIERHWGYFKAMLKGMLADDKQKVSSINILSKREEKQSLTVFNDTVNSSLISQTWLTLFTEQVNKTPFSTVVDDSYKCLSYRELDELSTNFAVGLLEQGLRKKRVNNPKRVTVVGVLAERNCDLLVAMVGVLKSGAAYLPLDPTQPKKRWQSVLNEAKPDYLIIGNELIDNHQWLNQHWQQDKIYTFREVFEHQHSVSKHSANLTTLPAPSLDDLAYIIYTSGSTGKPKGVMIEHRGMINNICSKFSPLTLDHQDIIAQTASQCFDISVWQFLTAPLLGAKVQILGNDTVRDPQKLQAAIAKYGVTIWEPVPSMLQAVLIQTMELPDLRWVLPTGEALTTGLVRNWFARYPDIPLMNAYGPAECSDDVAFEPIDKVVDKIYIGRPIANAHLHVLDEEMNLVPLGVIGELAISGAVVGRGYLNQTELTDKVFKNNPFCQHHHDERIYLSGDLVRRHQDGRIEYIGRKDHQVKIRGFRIELGEIEQALSGLPQVNEALVIATTDDRDDKFLVAYVTNNKQCAVPMAVESMVTELKDALKESLPDYMIPRLIISLDSFPLTANGKIDRKALPVPNLSDLVVNYVAPSSDIEKHLCTIWQELLGLDQVGINDDFFLLGGHSVLAVQVVSQLRQRLLITLPLNALFIHSKLVDLAKVAGKMDISSLEDFELADRTLPIALSYAQQRLWFIDQIDKQASAAYHMPDGLSLKGTLDKDALVKALNHIVDRHEILRTRFVTTNGIAQQFIETSTGISLIYQDLQNATQEEYELTCRQEAEELFDLEKGPLIRGRLIKLATDEHVLLITMHHIISDGWSFGVITKEISDLYEAFSQGKINPLAALPLQYADFSLWQNRCLQGEKLEQQQNYWLEKLKGAPELVSLPLDRPRPDVQDYAGAGMDVSLNRELSQKLKLLSQKHGTTLYVTLLAAWAAVVSRLAAQDDVVIGSPNSNRTRAEFESLIGFFVNTQAMRINFDAEPTVGELLAQVKATTIEALSHQDIQFEQVVEVINPLRSAKHSPIFQLMFIWDNTPEEEVVLGDLLIANVDSAEYSAQFDLSLSLVTDEEQILGRFSYASALFDEETIKNHWSYLETMLTAMVADDECKVGQIPLLNATQHQQLIYDFNNTEQLYSQSAFVHQLIEQQSILTPEAVAVDFEGQTLSYALLNERANQLAHYLLTLGIEPGVRVAICVHRSMDMVIAILAVLKAGGAYVPIDPDLPLDRISYMLVDSSPAVVLTQKMLLDDVLSSSKCSVQVLDEYDWQQTPWGQYDTCNVNTSKSALSLSDLAYVIYTSGSTGLPKGVMVEHASVLNRIQWMQQKYPLMREESTLQKTPFSFDVSVPEFFWPLAYGARIILARPDGHKDSQYLAQLIVEKSITTVSFVPSMLQVFLAQQAPCPSLKMVFCAGEALSASLVRESKKLWPHAQIHNLYGPTEATVYATALRCDSHEEQRGSIGQPIANTKIYILDRYKNPVPLGVAGEMYIGGEGIARGYLNNPELSNKVFLADPFSTKVGARMYKTGDLADWQHNGSVTYLGRNDFQVKVRGFRIELGEIEAQLSRLNGVQESVVIAQKDVSGNMFLIAYIIADSKNTPRILREQLSNHLPEYMLPAAYVVVPSFPMTTNGKLDRKSLPKPDDSAYVQSVYEEPQGKTEEVLAHIWSELLHVERVGRLDNFFDLGGHSLLAIQLISQIRHQLGVELPIAELFMNAKLLDLANKLNLSDLVTENKLMAESESLEELEW